MCSEFKVIGLRRTIARIATVAAVSAASIGGALAQTASLAPDVVAATATVRVSGYFTAFAAALQDELRGNSNAELREAYGRRGFRPIWAHEDDQGVVTFPEAAALLDVLDLAGRHALPVQRYRSSALRGRVQAFVDANGGVRPSRDRLERAAELERDLSRVFAAYVRDVSSGAIEPRRADKDIKVRPRRPEMAGLIVEIGAAADKPRKLRSFAPQSADYQRLLEEYAAAQVEAERAASAEPLRTRKTLKPGQNRPQIARLRVRLAAIGALPQEALARAREEGRLTEFDDELVDAVRDFQRRNGLAVDGVVGPQTRRALNAPKTEKVEKIAVNLERIRWLNYDRGQRHIRVNIADFTMALVQDGAPVFTSDVVVGKAKDHETPEFNDEMTHIVFNPVWHVPYSIATEEILPAVQADMSYLDRKNMWVSGPGGGYEDPWYIDWSSLSTEFFPYRIKQRSGPGNALGEVKFIFPNQYSIYLHDTPAKKLFRRSYRAFSHGCVRVAQPRALAEALLAVEKADPSKAYKRAVRGDRERYYELKAPVPVYLTYRTAWVDDAGELQQRQDIYRRDRSVARALRKAGVDLPSS
ncbi:MAG: L,D-transpeptidase family protein [Pseudomonadota bacterium]